MSRRRRLQLPPPERFDFDGTPYMLCDNLGRADAMIVAADEPIARAWSDDGGDLDSLTRRRADVSYFMDAARLAARAAMRAGDELDLHRQGA
jgi:hypothetical protein